MKRKKIELLSRRELLILLGGSALVGVSGCTKVQSSSDDLTKIVGCVVSPEQTAGPYFVDEKLNRTDIRSNPADKKVKTGVLLNLELSILQVTKNSCKPISNAMVDVWHCDALGTYSDVDDFSADTKGQKFLRGFQMTNSEGKVKFKTIYPGWYDGRTVHIHYKVRTNPNKKNGYEHTSQLYFDDVITKKIQKLKPYSDRKARRVENRNDGIYQDGGTSLMLNLTKKGNSYMGKYNIGLKFD